MEKEIATDIVKKLQAAGYIALFVGGCTRDALMGIIPKDYDIATNALPDAVEALFEHTIAIGKSFGVIVVIKGDYSFEVVTLRIDSKNSNGRHPDKVIFTDSLKEDASRRDFSMNSMYYNPVTTELFDFYGGVYDIEDKIISCVGEASSRFKEDKLRMLRAIRFATTLGFTIEEYTFNSIPFLSHLIKEVSWERIKMELDKILLSSKPSVGFDLLSKSGLLEHILPEIKALESTEQSLKWHSEGSTYKHTMMALDALAELTDDLDMLYGILLHDVGKAKCTEVINNIIKHPGHDIIGADMAEDIMIRFKSSTAQKNAVVFLVKEHMRIKSADKMKKSKLRTLMVHPLFKKLVMVSEQDSKNAIPADEVDGLHKFDWMDRIKVLQEEVKNEIILPACLISGKDLIKCEMIPGPLFSVVLKYVRELQLEGKVDNADEAMQVVKEMINE